MRPGQQHNKRGRGRNRHRSGGGGGGGGGGGNPLTRVYDSNGPDVKVRGTAQTIAEKYLQLGRDAQSSGDIVMAESYYQHAEHYLRILAEAQAYQQQTQQQFRRPGEEFDDDEGDDMAEGEGEEAAVRPPAPQPQGLGDQPDIQGVPPEYEGERAQQPQQQNFRPNREFRDRDQQGNREGQPQGRFRPRWQDRRDRNQGGGTEPRDGREQNFQPREARVEEPAREAPAVSNGGNEEASQWEAPSFLRRPAAVPAETEAAAEVAVERRPRLKPRRERSPEDTPAPETSGE